MTLDMLNVMLAVSEEGMIERQSVAHLALQAVRFHHRELALGDLLGWKSRLLGKLGERRLAAEHIFESLSRGKDYRRLLAHAAADLDRTVVAQKATDLACDLRHGIG